MAKDGKKLLDSDMHIVEPPDLWQRYIDPAFQDQAPRGWPGHENPSVLEVGGTVYPKQAAVSSQHYRILREISYPASERVGKNAHHVGELCPPLWARLRRFPA